MSHRKPAISPRLHVGDLTATSSSTSPAPSSGHAAGVLSADALLPSSSRRRYEQALRHDASGGGGASPSNTVNLAATHTHKPHTRPRHHRIQEQDVTAAPRRAKGSKPKHKAKQPVQQPAASHDGASHPPSHPRSHLTISTRNFPTHLHGPGPELYAFAEDDVFQTVPTSPLAPSPRAAGGVMHKPAPTHARPSPRVRRFHAAAHHSSTPSGPAPAAPSAGPALRLNMLRGILSDAPSAQPASHHAAASSATSSSTASRAVDPTVLPRKFEENESEELEAFLQLETGEDAITFFARYGDSTPIKFVYCNRPSTEGEYCPAFRPYDLVVVPRKQVGPEYFTISASGVVHVRPNHPSEFISLADWMHESTAFNILRSVPFFKHYLVARMFRAWRQSVRYSIYCQQRKKLSQRLFLSRPSFCKPLMHANALIREVGNVSLFTVRNNETYDADTFTTQQLDERTSASNKFEGVVEKLETLVEGVCWQVKDRARAAERALATDNASLTGHRAGSQAKAKSIVALKKEKAERVRRFRHARGEVELLSQFIRLIDYIEVEQLVAAAANTAEAMAHRLATRRVPLFKTSISFSPSTIVFNPSRREFHGVLQDMLSGVISVVSAVDRIPTSPNFKAFVPAEVAKETPHVDYIVTTLARYQREFQRIREKVDMDFDAIQEDVSKHEKFREVYDFGRAWDADEYMSREHTLASLRGEMERQLRWAREIDQDIRRKIALPNNILQVECAGFSSELMPITENALRCIRQMILSIFHNQCDELFRRYKAKIQELQGEPANLKHFVAHVRMVQAIRDEGEEMKKLAVQCADMHDLLDRDENIRIPSEDAVLFEDLQEAVQSFERQLIDSDRFVDSSREDMTRRVYKSIAKLVNELRDLQEEMRQSPYSDPDADPPAVLAQLAEIEKRLADIKRKSDLSKEHRELLESDAFQTKGPGIDELAPTIKEYQRLERFWSAYRTFVEKADQWNDADIKALDVEGVNHEVNTFAKNLHSMKKKPVGDGAYMAKFKTIVDEWKSEMPTLLELGNHAMRQPHWERLFTELGAVFYPKETIRLRKLRSLKVFERRGVVSAVCEQAVGEFGLETSLAKVSRNWQDIEFIVINYQETDDVFILGDVEDITALLEESQVSLQTMLASRFILPLQKDVETWDRKLAHLSDLLDEWLQCQRNWMYLEPIFSAADIQRQLPMEAKMFAEVDRFWKETMTRVQAHPNVMRVVAQRGLLEEIVSKNEQLDTVQKHLEEYLETKRAAFPRFYFLSNDELLQILSQSRDPHAVQPHLRKIFDNVSRMRFTDEPDSLTVQSLISGEGEEIPLDGHVITQGATEEWLNEIEVAMRRTTKTLIKRALLTYPDAEAAVDRAAWLELWPAQAILAVDQIMWTHGAATALRRASNGEPKALEQFLEFSKRQISAMVLLVRGDLTKLQRRMMSSLIIIDVHARDVIQEMVELGCSSESDYQWTKQLRYYWGSKDATADVSTPSALLTQAIEASATPASSANDLSALDSEDCLVRQTNSEFTYGYEYLGNSSRLVITPLTDKAYLTLTGALHLHYGGAPAGPAGTGKTETVKDLAKALAVPCIVMNCSDGLDTKMMGRFFSGLAQAGAWACFDEFNRINIEVLSVIAQQILTIQQAIMADMARFDFEGRSIPLNQNFGVFITMNPGYAGRTELPDNLKALFRPVAMMIPDYALIAQIILFSEGFQTASPLSKKMVQLYKLSSEQLSKQDHYDFGMRAVKSVLVMAGALKRRHPELPEDVVLIRAMRDSNAPKFLAHDLPLFYGIIGDLFPNVVVPDAELGALQRAIEQELHKSGLQCVDAFVDKILQLHETMIVRHGVMVVGSTMTGKSTCSRTLAHALTALHEAGDTSHAFFQTVKRYILNPKAVTMGELYGQSHPVTGEWSDGLVAWIVRQAVADQTDVRKWVVFDGPVDALWIENMNTVLDDNKTLCLANGERIKLPSTIAMVFEVEDLAVASPATVSRCGMVYLEPMHLGWQPLLDSWLPSLEDALPTEAARVYDVLSKNIAPVLEFVRAECIEPIASVDNNLVNSCLRLVSAFLTPENGVDADARSSEDLSHLVSMHLFNAIVWSFGANLVDDSRQQFSDFVREQLAPTLAPDLPPPEEGTVYDFTIDVRTLKFVPWAQRVRKFVYNPDTPYFNILVPTADTTKYSFMLRTLLTAGQNALVMGGTGVGKTVIVQSLLRDTAGGAGAEVQATPDEDGDGGEAAASLAAALENVGSMSSRFLFVPVMFSAQTTSRNLQDVFETKLEKRRKNLFGAPVGKKVVVFVDDLNMPQREEYGAQPPVELLRQCLDQGGFYDRKKLFFKRIQDVQFVSACAPPGGGRNPVTQRALRHFHMLWHPELSDASMRTIFTAILDGFCHNMRGTSGIVDRKDLASLASPLVDASVRLYSKMSEQMLPTPDKSHYTFNLRDLSKIFQGLLQVTSGSIVDAPALVRLWCHESARVFRDRLVDDKDRGWFDRTSAAVLKEELDKALGDPSVDQTVPLVSQLNDDPGLASHYLFGDYMTVGAEDDEERPYAEVTDRTKLGTILTDSLQEYNMTFSKQMDLVFFQDAVEHLSRVSRILRQPRGNALLVGVGGSGRQSLTRMAAFMAGYACIGIEITRGFGVSEWRESLKQLLMTAGAENKQVVFLMSDSQVVHESFLEDINNLLNSGEVPNLFEAEELEPIIAQVRPLVRQAGIIETRDNILEHFVQLVRENLHVVLAFSPIGDAFRARCRQYPSLVNCCTIDWYNPWPEEALYSVAQRFLSVQGEGLGIDEYRDALCRMCVHIHMSVTDESKRFHDQLHRHNYVTPTSYLELIRLYLSMLDGQRTKVSTKLDRYSNGLTKLRETNTVVAELRESLIKLQPELAQSVKETAELLVVLEKDQGEAEEKRTIVAHDAEECMKTTRDVQTIKDDCQRDLDEALPAYESAIRALDTLKRDDITVVKSFAKPPELVQLVMEAVCVLFGKKPSWDDSKRLLGNSKFLSLCREYDKDNIPQKVIRRLAKYMKNPEFVPERLKSVSTAAVSLCMWVRAMDTYARVAKTVEPKRQALAEAEQRLHEAQDQLASKQAELAEVEARVASLEAKYREKLAQRESLQQQEELTKARLVRAEKLVNGLGSEGERWAKMSEKLTVAAHNLVGNVMLAAGCVSYVGPFTAQFREKLMLGWSKKSGELRLPADSQFSLVDTLAEPVVVRQWNAMGLPADNYSIENGLFVTHGRRWPLMIDPQAQANRWIKNMGKANSLHVIKLSEPNYLRTLENAIRYGQPVLLEDVEEKLDAAIEPVLLKQIFKKGGQWLLRLGDQDVPYLPDFRFYITTKLANPHYLPEVFVKVTIINFTVTPKGLEDQLLEVVCGLERPDLEEKNDSLIVQIADDQTELDEIEARILQMLSESKGEILDDEELIEALGASKATSEAVKARVVEAEQTVAEINTLREQYRVVAKRGSILYFVVANLANVDPMYQYSLLYFTNLYRKRIQTSEASDELATRLETLKTNLVDSIYKNICRGLFEKHKLLFSFMMAMQISKQVGRVTDQQVSALMLGTASLSVQRESSAARPEWVSEAAWETLSALEAGVPSMPQVVSGPGGMAADSAAWREWAQGASPAESPMPGDWEATFGEAPLARLLVLRALREEHTVFGMKAFVTSELGASFAQAPPFDLHGACDDSSPTVPVVFVLSPGADPMSHLLKLAEERNMAGNRFKYISLGQGQGPIAERLMDEGRRNGDWVCLQNCHLAASWMPQLERILAQAAASPHEIHPEFRLWLTSMPSKQFPVPILQNSIKLTNEPPKGLRANVTRTFLDMSEEEYEACSKPRAFKKLLFGLAFFHAAVQERRKYGPIGWNIPYAWMDSDLQVSKTQLRMYLDEQDEVPWETLREIIGEVNYAGRVTDNKDQRCVKSMLARYITPDILDDTYRFSNSDVYFAPPEGTLAEARAYVDTLPWNDPPAVFGLHENADITFLLKESSTLMDTLKVAQTVVAASGGDDDGDEVQTPSDVVAALASALESRLPARLRRSKAHPSTFEGVAEGTNTLGVFLGQELDRFNKLVDLLTSSLRDLQRAIKGLVVMSADLEAIFSALLYNEVPDAWAAYPSVKPLASWFDDFVERVEFMRSWLEKGAPHSFWISGFFFPQGAATAILQRHARSTKIPIDTLRFRTQVMPYASLAEVPAPPERGAYVHGLFLEGASWDADSAKLVESPPGQLVTPMPVIWLDPVTVDEYDAGDAYACPLYKTSVRAGELSTTGHSTNFVMFCDLPSDKPPEHWIRRGTALLTQLDS